MPTAGTEKTTWTTITRIRPRLCIPPAMLHTSEGGILGMEGSLAEQEEEEEEEMNQTRMRMANRETPVKSENETAASEGGLAGQRPTPRLPSQNRSSCC